MTTGDRKKKNRKTSAEDIATEIPVLYAAHYRSGHSYPLEGYVPTQEEATGVQSFGKRLAREAKRRRFDITPELILTADSARNFSASSDFKVAPLAADDAGEGKKATNALYVSHAVYVANAALRAGDHNAAHTDWIIQHELSHLKHFDGLVMEALRSARRQQAAARLLSSYLRKDADLFADLTLAAAGGDGEKKMMKRFFLASNDFVDSLAADMNRLHSQEKWMGKAASGGAIRDRFLDNTRSRKRFEKNMLNMLPNLQARELLFNEHILPALERTTLLERENSAETHALKGMLTDTFVQMGQLIRERDFGDNLRIGTFYFRFKNAIESLADDEAVRWAKGNKTENIKAARQFLDERAETLHSAVDPDFPRKVVKRFHPDPEQREADMMKRVNRLRKSPSQTKSHVSRLEESTTETGAVNPKAQSR